MIDLYVLVTAVNTQNYNPTLETSIPTRNSTYEANAGIAAEPLTAETKK